MNKILILGLGKFGSAIAHLLSSNTNNEVVTFSRNPTKSLKESSYELSKSENLNFTDFLDYKIKNGDVIINALPSSALPEFMFKYFKKFHKLNNKVHFINLAKGLLFDKSVGEYIKNSFKVQYHSLYGPTFDDGFNQRVGMTFYTDSDRKVDSIESIFYGCNISLDIMDNPVLGDYCAILKNVYAIIYGIIDVSIVNLNTKYMILTEIIKEYEDYLMNYFESKSINLNTFGGLGDLLLTLQNSRSRNRVLGEMIGRGLYDPTNRSNTVVFEGVKTVSGLKSYSTHSFIPLLKSLMNKSINVDEFINKLSCPTY